MNQQTLKKSYSFEGKGLHTGRFAHMTIEPAPVNTGIVFIRTDLNLEIPALAEYVSKTARSTSLSLGKASVGTIEHVLSALTGLGIDNAYIKIDEKEVPILDGSAREYVEAITADGVVEQDAERKWVEIKEPIEFCAPKIGSLIRIEPADEFSVDLTIDFNSHVIGVQNVKWKLGDDFATQIAPCHTFCFLHEIQLLATLGLVKGGSVQNALVVVEKPVSESTLLKLSKTFKQPYLGVSPEGYLNNLKLMFPDECGRHKMLDILGDLRLCGGFLKAKVTAFKPGHRVNTETAKLVRAAIKK